MVTLRLAVLTVSGDITAGHTYYILTVSGDVTACYTYCLLTVSGDVAAGGCQTSAFRNLLVEIILRRKGIRCGAVNQGSVK